ncbi:MAG TPA: methionine--tRNA ligase [Pyrinomonadaceae bacterium]|nr:methionine--tRNA ligase [Pyrinomonadaceae bacterium]
MKSFYVTTPIYYANDLPHLGSLYTTIVADSLRRHKRQLGCETYFLTGTDEHGINIQRLAERKGASPQEYTDTIVNAFKRMFASFELDTAHGGYDIFMRTTEPFHYAGVAELWRRVARSKTPKGNDSIYKGHYEGWFCPNCAEYKTEDEYQRPEREEEAPTCLVHLKPLDRVSEESYFFRLSDFDQALLSLYESRPDFILPEARRNEMISFVRRGLDDLSISRQKTSVAWAIPVPDDPDHSIYVWFDALSNYITAIGFGNEERNRAVGFEKFWPAMHLIGKDILRQHTVYWPAFLLAADIEPPRSVFAHGMWQDSTGRRMSKTLGNTIDLELLHKFFPTDAIRYFCLREMVFGQDGRFGYEALIDRANSDLASGLGNLSSRILTMIGRYCEGLVPSGRISEDKILSAKRSGVDTDETTIAGFIEHARDQFLQHFENYAFSRALEVAWSVVARVDKMISEAKPWDLVKDDNQRQTLHAILYRSAESLRWLCVLLQPVMPRATQEIYIQLGLSDSLSAANPAELQWGGLQEGTHVGEIKPVFPRLDKAGILGQIKGNEPTVTVHATEAEAVASANPAASTRPQPPMQGATEADAVTGAEGVATLIDIGDFAKVDLRVGQVLSAERVPKSDKLLLMNIDIGEEKPRQVLAGIAQYYEPTNLLGRKVVVVANLKPRKLRGYESQGMVVAASIGEEGRPVIATFTEEVPNGARLK